MKRTTISISMQCYDKLNALKQKLERILEKTISFDQTLQVILEAKQLSDILDDLILEKE